MIEQNGQLIVVRMGDENPKYPVITDGVVQVEILETIGKSEEWQLRNWKKKVSKKSQISLSLNMTKFKLVSSPMNREKPEAVASGFHLSLERNFMSIIQKLWWFFKLENAVT